MGLIPPWGNKDSACFVAQTKKREWNDNSVAINIFTECHHHQIPDHFITPKRNPTPVAITPHSFFPTAPDNHHFIFYLYRFAYSGHFIEWNHNICLSLYVSKFHSFFMAKQYPIVSIHHIFFIHSSLEDHLGVSTFCLLLIVLLWKLLYRFLYKRMYTKQL